MRFEKPALCSKKQDSGAFLSRYSSTPRGPPPSPRTRAHARTRTRARVCVWVCRSYMYRIYIFFFVFEPFESKLQRRISMCFLRARTFSDIVIQIRKCILVQYYYLNLPTLIKILPVVPDASFLAITKYLWSKIPSRITSFYL